MADKVQSIEEKLGMSIYYNLKILKIAVKTTPEFEECLSPTMFLKSKNTKAFIHITHFLFTILDSKEFKAKFYWPLNDKRAENSYRTSSVEFFNSIIEKNQLQQDKVTSVLVVHPGGKKFMSLILDLIQLAIVKVMKDRNIEQGKSIDDIEKAEEFMRKTKVTEAELLSKIEDESKKFKKATDSIEEMYRNLTSPVDESLVKVEDFLNNWNESNKTLFKKILDCENLAQKTHNYLRKFYENAKKILAIKNIEDFKPQKSQLEELFNESKITEDGKVALHDMLSKLLKVLPAIIQYTNNWSIQTDPSEQSKLNEELKFIESKLESIQKISNELHEFNHSYSKSLTPLLEKLSEKRRKSELKAQEEETEDKFTRRIENDRKDQELMSLLMTPKFEFNPNAVATDALIGTRISLIEEQNEKETTAMNRTFYRIPRIIKNDEQNSRLNSTQISNNSSMKPPQQIFCKLKTKDLFERAISKVPNRRLLGPITNNQMIRSTPKLSSTMFAMNQNHTLFNCTGVSAISEGSPNFDSNITAIETPFKPPEMIKIAESLETPILKSEEISVSPRRQLVRQFAQVKENSEDLQDSVFKPLSTTSQLDNKSLEKSGNATSAGTDFTFAAFKIKNDEDLFNVSDTILDQLNDLDLSSK